ncbi:LysE/ArgO family amino acid transporter [Halopseudomonas bauzanensis]|uniref:L-lysine exporter family protein LysE/ArgO n=1 Tax=Halopseudomonas bauzanensis TaxID=653930 RepID=A0A1I4JHP1_9GAMM|nr:L-lysine exporter family protein LysE/ArgO [Halopseudomonas bauzanensis]SFL66090.1 L-lysine exporter family protein LysE/ArgO [Halopseudomonas bauzanensis]
MQGMGSYMNGFLVAAGLIMAIGAQNAFVLAQGLRREHHLSAAVVCMTCDALLVTAGTFGLASLLQRHPLAMEITRWGGILFLVGYALLALRRALGSQSLVGMDPDRPRRSRQAVLMTTLAVTLLNPHVYLDTLVLIGSVGAQQDLPALFALGAASASVVWFFSLALGAARLAPWLQRPLTWRLIDIGVAAMMLRVAWSLVWPA